MDIRASSALENPEAVSTGNVRFRTGMTMPAVATEVEVILSLSLWLLSELVVELAVEVMSLSLSEVSRLARLTVVWAAVEEESLSLSELTELIMAGLAEDVLSFSGTIELESLTAGVDWSLLTAAAPQADEKAARSWSVWGRVMCADKVDIGVAAEELLSASSVRT